MRTKLLISVLLPGVLFASLFPAACSPKTSPPPEISLLPSEQPLPPSEPVITPVPQPLGNNPAISETNRWFPANMKPLTDDQKKRMVDIALNTSAAVEWRQKDGKYTATFSWLALFPDTTGGNLTGYRIFDYETVETGIPIYPPGTVILAVDPKTTEVYPNVAVHFGEPAQHVVSVAVDLNTSRIVFAEDYPAGKGIAITPPIR